MKGDRTRWFFIGLIVLYIFYYMVMRQIGFDYGD